MPIQEVFVCEKSVRKCTPNTEKPVSHKNTHIDIESATICYLTLPQSHILRQQGMQVYSLNTLSSLSAKCVFISIWNINITICKQGTNVYVHADIQNKKYGFKYRLESLIFSFQRTHMLCGIIIRQVNTYLLLTLNFRFFMFRIEPVCFLHHSLAANTTLFLICFTTMQNPPKLDNCIFKHFSFLIVSLIYISHCSKVSINV